MMLNDIKMSLRVMQRERLYSVVNITGLSFSFALSFLILYYVQFESSYESHNANKNRVVRITMDYLDGETLIDQDSETYAILGPMIHETFAEVEDFARVHGMGEIVLKVEEEAYREMRAFAVDTSFLRVFGYQMISGSMEEALSQPNQVILSQRKAVQYFGDENPLGKVITSARGTVFEVVGIVPNPPLNTHLKFDLLFPYSLIEPIQEKRESPWYINDTYTYLQLNDASSFPAFTANLAAFSGSLADQDFLPDERIVAQPIGDIHLHSHKTYEIEENGDARTVWFLFCVAVLVIITAIVNYVNLSTAKALDRAKEVGIKKVIGSNVSQLRVRFFIEAILVNVISGAIAVVIMFYTFDAFKAIAGLPESLPLWQPLFVGLFLGALVISICLSGIFPAFILASFRPVAVLKGQVTHSKSGVLLRKVLVVAQFGISIFLMVQTFAIGDQIRFLHGRELGLNKEQVLVMRTPATRTEMSNFGSFQTELLRQPDFQHVSLSNCVPGLATTEMGSTTGINLRGATEEHSYNFFVYFFDSAFLETMQIELLAGDNFQGVETDSDYIIVNEASLRLWGLPDPVEAIGVEVNMWGSVVKIGGVVRNFSQSSIKNNPLPMIFKPTREFGDYISIRLGEGEVAQQVKKAEEVFLSMFPNSPFNYFFLDSRYDAFFRIDRQFQTVFTILSVFAVLITCLGLFGLVSFTMAKKTKEIGVRKVLGAGVAQILRMVSSEFVFLAAIATAIGIPVGYYVVEQWLSVYAFRIEVQWWHFVVPLFTIIAVAALTVFLKAYQASMANPVEALRDE